MVRRVLSTTVVAVVLAGSLAFLASPAQAGGFIAADEGHVQEMVNATRRGKGLPTLVQSDGLVQMARGQSVRQAEKGNIFHNPDLGGEITKRGLSWQKVGENVGMGPNVDLIEEAFLNSPHHYENIVDPKFDAIGVGVVDGADGRRYVTQVFADLAAAAPPAARPPVPTRTPTPAATSAPAAPSTAPAATSAPSPAVQPAKPAPTPSAEPNVVVGGVIEPLDLPDPAFDQPKRTSERKQASGAGSVDRFIDFVTFWS